METATIDFNKSIINSGPVKTSFFLICSQVSERHSGGVEVVLYSRMLLNNFI